MLPAGKLNPVHITCVESAFTGGQSGRYSAYPLAAVPWCLMCHRMCHVERDGCEQSMLIVTHYTDGY
eukprot:COSAG02_NODE_3232_length_7136_cov_264.805741_8_plen_67_part_00